MQVKTDKEKHIHNQIRAYRRSAENITNSLQRFKVPAVHGWSDSMLVLHWIKGNGTYKQFVRNRIDHIN